MARSVTAERATMVVALAVTLQAATSFALTRLLSVEARNMIAKLRAQVQQHVLRLPVRSFETTKSGESLRVGRHSPH